LMNQFETAQKRKRKKGTQKEIRDNKKESRE